MTNQLPPISVRCDECGGKGTGEWFVAECDCAPDEADPGCLKGQRVRSPCPSPSCLSGWDTEKVRELDEFAGDAAAVANALSSSDGSRYDLDGNKVRDSWEDRIAALTTERDRYREALEEVHELADDDRMSGGGVARAALFQIEAITQRALSPKQAVVPGSQATDEDIKRAVAKHPAEVERSPERIVKQAVVPGSSEATNAATSRSPEAPKPPTPDLQEEK